MASDNLLQFCNAQNVFGNGTTVQSADWIDQGVAQDIAGGGEMPDVEIVVSTTFAGGTSAQFQVCAVDVGGGSNVVLATTAAIAIAGLVAPTINASGQAVGGTRIILPMGALASLPATALTHLRLQTVNVGNNTAGAISARLLPKASTVFPGKAYAAGY